MKTNIKVSNKKNIFNDNNISFEERELDIEEQKKIEEEREKRKKQSPYSNFYQFNREHSDKMIWLAINHPKAHATLLFLLDQMDHYNSVICSYQVLQEVLGVGQATIARSIKVLKENGFLAILKSGTANVYVVNKDLAWSSWGNNQKYCKFPTNVILSIKENEKNLKQIESCKIKHINIKD